MVDIFVNYRTADARFGAAAAHQFLVGRFGPDRVFLDHVSMRPGAVYPDEIRAALEVTRALVVLIGPEWLAVDQDTGIRLVDREDDWVRREIRRALERDIVLVPVLLDGTALPTDLPEDIRGLLYRQTAAIGHRSLSADLGRLADVIVERVPELALPDLFTDEPALPPDPLPSELLRAEHRVVGFRPAGDQFERLTAWLGHGPEIATRLITGPGGGGKTRLATELVAHARGTGWHAGFVREDPADDVLARVGALTGSLLLVIDYAEARAAEVAALCTALLHRTGITRVLLLARSPGRWQRGLTGHRDPRIASLFTAVQAEEVARLVDAADRRAQFDHAADGFRRQMAAEITVAAPADLADERYSSMLDVHAAALAAVLDALIAEDAGDLVPERADPVRRVLDHEERYWQRSAPVYGLPARADRLAEVVAAATLAGADDSAAARAVLTALRPLDGADRAAVADHAAWLAKMYPGELALNPLRPDRLGEDLVADVLVGYPELAADLAPVVDDHQLTRALTVLARAARRHAAVVRLAMTDLLSVEPANRIAIGMTVATQVDDPTIVEVLGTLRGDPDFTEAVVTNLPEHSLTLAAFAVAHTDALLRAETRRTPQDPGFIAELRHNLALRLVRVGEYDRALSVAGEAVRDFRALGTEPEDILELAGALTTLSSVYAEAGLSADGEPAAEEAVTLLSDIEHGVPVDALRSARADALLTLADLRHEQGDLDGAVVPARTAVDLSRDLVVRAAGDEHASRLASALDSLGAVLVDRGELRPSLAAITEAVTLYRELDASAPDHYRSELIRALGNLAGAHAELGQWAEGAKFGTEAVTLARTLVARHGDVHLVRLADTLNNSAALLRRLDNEDQALSYLNEAVSLYRGLADRLPGTHLAGLAGALHNLGNCLHELDRPLDAVQAYEESVEIHRKLGGPPRDEEDLAELLVGLAHARAALDDEETALELIAEAIAMLDRAMAAERNTTRRKLAHALHLASSTAFDLGMFEEAVRDADRAAELFRIVVEDVDERDLRDEHAAVVHGLARALDAHGDHDRAADAFTEAIERYRALSEDDARAELAGTLTNAAVCASSRGDHTAALALVTEAVSILRELGDDHDIRLALAEALNNLADTHCDTGNLPAAVAIADEAITLATALHDEDRPDTTALTVYTLITRARAGGDVATLLRKAIAVANLDHTPVRPSVGGEAVALATTLHEAGWPGAVLAVDMLIAHAETHPRTAKRALREAATIAAADDEDEDLRALVTAAATRLGIRLPTLR